MRRLWGLAVGVALAVVLGARGVHIGIAGPAERTQRGGVLRVADEPPGGPFGVPWIMPVFGIIAAMPVYETLLWVDAYGRVSPRLAERWEVAPDRKALLLRLRRGAQFHDGTEMTAEAVKFSLEESIRVRRLPAYIKSVDVLDRYTVRVNLEKWDNGVFLALGGSAALIASPATIQRLGQERAQWQPVGTGPFRIVRYDPNAYADYVRFNQYWDQGKPYMDRLEMRFIRDVQTLKAALLAGQLDVAGFGDPQVIAELRGTGRFRTITGPPGSGILMIVPDSANADSPFADRRVREALAYAVDRAAIARALGYGNWEPWDQIAHPASPAALQDYRGPTYNPARARELLAQAGYPNGFDSRLTPAPFLPREVGVVIQRYLREVGIRTELDTPEIARYAEYQRKGWRGLLLHYFGYFPNFNNYIRFYFTNSPEGFVSMRRPEGLDRLVEDSASTLTVQRHKVQQMHRVLLQDLTVIPVYLSMRTYIARPEVRDTGHLTKATWPYWEPAKAWKARQ
ncbi:MAG: ABC transporter substrate-binding protein [Armatimonadetes bacterium]|nr:ABC transporter substrate-binding protein [Armatimonadota bacterium]MDW8153121.1 ABC transporter substrate-binding protein [Armatimonadota bacterium]